ncbi:uncharacterized protein LOC113271944 [Papaver somniferum]|uniref:uncharacterized protein LOC113271944 n=1 Tax=Papaver somniferum TaxID=3469 RepID=UPI000E70313E|nr:uncharacterized protein LOC113271944 [Papaver somniferum]
MVRKNSAAGQPVPIRRSRRIARRRRSGIAESSRMGERHNQDQQVHHPIQREPVQDNVIDYDRVSVHTSQTVSTEEAEQRTGEGGLIEGTDEDMTIEELRHRLDAERSLPVFTNIFDGTTCAIQHIKAYVQSLLQWEDHDAVLCKYFSASLSGEALKWFEGLPTGIIRSFNHLQSIFLGAYINNNVLRPGIEQVFGLGRRTNEDLRSLTTRWRTMCSEMDGRVDERNLILAFINALFATDLLYTQIFRIKETISMIELREYPEEYIALEQKEKEMESYLVANRNTKAGNASLLPKITNTIASTSQGRHEKDINEDQQKLVAMGSRDQEEW